MQTGTLGIRRGHQMSDELPAAPRLSLVPRCQRLPAQQGPEQPPPRPASTEYHAIHDRLAALERLARLFEQGALTEAEFAAEKAALLSLPVDELVLVESFAVGPGLPALAPPRRASLLGRLFDWRLLPFGLVAGLAFSFATQPRETMRFFDEALRLIGA